jgi:hypothetical protein
MDNYINVLQKKTSQFSYCCAELYEIWIKWQVKNCLVSVNQRSEVTIVILKEILIYSLRIHSSGNTVGCLFYSSLNAMQLTADPMDNHINVLRKEKSQFAYYCTEIYELRIRKLWKVIQLFSTTVQRLLL